MLSREIRGNGSTSSLRLATCCCASAAPPPANTATSCSRLSSPANTRATVRSGSLRILFPSLNAQLHFEFPHSPPSTDALAPRRHPSPPSPYGAEEPEVLTPPHGSCDSPILTPPQHLRAASPGDVWYFSHPRRCGDARSRTEAVARVGVDRGRRAPQKGHRHLGEGARALVAPPRGPAGDPVHAAGPQLPGHLHPAQALCRAHRAPGGARRCGSSWGAHCRWTWTP